MKSMIEIENLDFVGSTFNEIACLHGENAAIQAGVAADPEWGEDELDMSGAVSAVELLPDLVEFTERELKR